MTLHFTVFTLNIYERV